MPRFTNSAEHSEGRNETCLAFLDEPDRSPDAFLDWSPRPRSSDHNGHGPRLPYGNPLPRPQSPAPGPDEAAIYHASDDDFLRNIDVLSMRVPGGEENAKFAEAQLLATMERGAIVENAGRGLSVVVADRTCISQRMLRKDEAW